MDQDAFFEEVLSLKIHNNISNSECWNHFNNPTFRLSLSHHQECYQDKKVTADKVTYTTKNNVLGTINGYN